MPFLRHAAKSAAYLGCAGVGGVVGWQLASRMTSLLGISPALTFVLICVCAGLVLFLVAPIEERLFWGRLFVPSDADLKWIGRSSSTKLTSSISSPCSLGVALGMLLVVLV